MMHGSATVSTAKDVIESRTYYRDKFVFDVAFEYGLRDFDVADLDGNMIFFGMEAKTAS